MSTTYTMPSATTERRRSTSSTREKFPDLDPSVNYSSDLLRNQHEQDLHRFSAQATSPPKINGIPQAPSRQTQREGHLTWGEGSLNIAPPRRQHGRQKSLSDAIRTIRGRRASVSENAHELAEALKAPLSVKLTVCSSFNGLCDGKFLIHAIGALLCLVHELGVDEHILEIDPQCLPPTDHPHYITIRLRLGLVSFPCLSG